MRIILIKSEEPFFEEMLSCLGRAGCETDIIEAPDSPDESFIALLLNLVKVNGPDAIMSLGYIPYLSNACNIMDKIYVSWITSGFDSSNYDPSIRNAQNRIFSADMHLYETYKELGLKHVWFLPLAPEAAYLENQRMDGPIQRLIDSETNDVQVGDSKTLRILIITNSLLAQGSINNHLPLLKDSTKGYLDAFIESKKRDLTLRPVYARVHDYIRDDILDNYKIDNGLQSIAEAFDYQAIYPCVDESLANEYITELLECDICGHMDIISRVKPNIEDDRVNIYPASKVDYSFYKSKDKYDCVIFLPGFLSGTRLTQDMWNIMALGYVCIVPEMIDTQILGDKKPLSFKNQYELTVSLREVLKTDFKVTLPENDYNMRVNELLSCLNL